MFERFTDRARRVLVLAVEEARLLGHGFIGTEHILLGLIHEGDGIAARTLESLGISLESVREKVEEAIGPASTATTGSPPFTPRAKKVLELSLREALQLGHNYIGTEHMLLGLVREGEGIAAQALQSLGADLPRVREAVISRLSVSEAYRPVASSERMLPTEDLPRPGRRGRDDQPEWPTETVRYPILLVPGPRDPILIQGLECRIVGLLIFEEDFEIVWSVAGDPDLLWSQLGVLENDDHPPLGTSPRFMTVVTDDVGTVYERDSRVFTRSPSRWSGHVSCRPVPPVEARVLRLTWIDRSVEVQL